MADRSARLDGWKAIAAHLGHDRSTVVRWERNGLPVHRIPGNKSGVVYAFAHELDAWLRKDVTPQDSEATESPGRYRQPYFRRWSRPAFGLALLVVLAVLVVAVGSHPLRSSDTKLPRDPAMARQYLQARDDWASRTPDGLRRSIFEFGDLIKRQPKFAAAYAGLADAYLLSPEFDVIPQGIAFAKAQAAANAALVIDPGSAGANRALGFIAYWWRHDVKAARGYFAEALKAEPASAQTRFWFGNTLLDNGETTAGLGELNKARLLDPGSHALQADYAWASWENGSGDEGLDTLKALETQAPSLGTVSYYLAQTSFASGDVAGYLRHAQKWAAVLHPGGGQIAAQVEAFDRGGAVAVLDLIASSSPVANAHRYDTTLWSAGAASLAGRRDELLDLLARAEVTGERWNPKRWERSLFARWQGDVEVGARLKRLFGPKIPIERLADDSTTAEF
jgi:hypothetical protein